MVAGFPGCLFLLAIGCLAGAQVTQSRTRDLPGEAPVSVLQTEDSRLNIMTMGLHISGDYDDNALNSEQNDQADFAVLLQPHLGWRLSNPGFDWAADYTMGFSKSQNFAASDSLSHLLDSRFQLKPTKRLRVLVHEAYLSSANPFDQLQALESATGAGGRILPFESAAVTPASVRTEQASADIAYALSAHSTVGIGGEFFGARYTLPSVAVTSGQLLQDSSSAIGRAYYMRQVTRQQWMGLDYSLQKATFNDGQAWSLVHSVAFTHTIKVSPAITLSLFAGPERSVTQNETGTFASSSVPSGPQSAWQWSGGVVGGWTVESTKATARLSKRIDIGGLLGAAQLATVNAEVSHQFARQWTTRVLASYDHSRALVGPGTLSSSSVTGGVTHMLSPSLSVELQYWRVHMTSNGSLPAGFLGDHNRVLVSLSYEHKQALGK